MRRFIVIAITGLLAAACAPMTPSTQERSTWVAPPIEASPLRVADARADRLLLFREGRETPATYVISFDEGLVGRRLSLTISAPATADSDLQVELSDGELVLSGTAEEQDGGYLVGLAGLSPDEAGMVIRMSARREGNSLRGWAVIDADGRATATTFVAERRVAQRVVGQRLAQR